MQKSEIKNAQNGIITFKTGGTTSNPKLVVKTVRNLENESRDIFDELNLENGLEFISTTTTEHLFGYTFQYMLPLTHGFSVNPARINYPEDINVKNACLITTPSFLEAMRKYSSQPVIRPKVIIAAGAKLEKETFNYAKQIADRVVEIYGSTETGVIGYRENPEDRFKLFKGIKILETTDDYTKIHTDYSAESIVIIDDRIKLSGNFIEFIGRNGRILKIQEKRINSEEMEQTIIDRDFIKDCYCFEFKGKIASLAVLTEKGLDFAHKNGTLELIKQLKNSLNSKFDVVPQRWKFVYEIPKDIRGKFDKEEIRKIFELNLSLPLVYKRFHDGDTAELELCFLKNSNFFKGHFDKFPILPGVVQLFFANYYATKAFKIDCRCGQIRKIKFTNIIKPDKNIRLVFNKTTNGINFKYEDDEKTYSSGIFPIKNYL